ncbi:hypothetical protein ACWFRM_26010 [Streptomyces sp. NPDC055144]
MTTEDDREAVVHAIRTHDRPLLIDLVLDAGAGPDVPWPLP